MQERWQDRRLPARGLIKRPGLILVAVSTLALSTGFTQVKPKTISLDDLNAMRSRNVKTERVTYKGRKALRVTDAAAASVPDGERYVFLNNTQFQDGVIEIELTGA